ncbi:MAG TPA: hypothetical protein VII97_06770 [Anaerolineales bacterium]
MKRLTACDGRVCACFDGNFTLTPPQPVLEQVKTEVGDEWEDEFYWLADDAVPAVENLGFKVEYIQISAYAGFFCIVESSH